MKKLPAVASIKPLTKGTRILGIDPGLSGGYALLDGEGTLLDCGNFPTHQVKKSKSAKVMTQLDGTRLAETLLGFVKARELAHALPDVRAFIEIVSSRPRQQGQFQFGVNVGILHGILYAANIPFTGVTPQAWKAQYGIKRREEETKAQKKTEAREIAAKLYIKHADKFKRVKDDGVAEATLIALYGLCTLIF